VLSFKLSAQSSSATMNPIRSTRTVTDARGWGIRSLAFAKNESSKGRISEVSISSSVRFSIRFQITTCLISLNKRLFIDESRQFGTRSAEQPKEILWS
jgi:hypothetical protein